jgi:hypothetical protein
MRFLANENFPGAAARVAFTFVDVPGFLRSTAQEYGASSRRLSAA